MNYTYHKVNPKISDYIQTVLVLKESFDDGRSDLPLFTKGVPALLCRIINGTCKIKLFGISVPDENWTIEENTTLIAFFFKPFSFGTIFNLPAQKLKEQAIELNHWNVKKAKALRAQILQSKSQKEKIEILDHFILTQIQANKRDCELIRYATDFLMRNPNTDTPNQLSENLHLIERTFQRIFKKYIGTTPTHYRRICQFYFAFSQLKGKHYSKIADVAFNNGYFDQSHFIRSFKEFTKTTPNEYLKNGLNGKVQ